MADRYTYLPSLSPFLIFGLAAAWAEESVITVNKRGLLVKVLSAAVAILGIILLSSLTIAQIRVWKDSYTLWNYVIERDPQGIPSAYNGRALAFEERGLYNEALADYQKAVDLSPSYTEAYINRGSLLVKLNRVDLAIADYNHAIALNPARYEAYFNLGLLYGRTGFTGRAIEYFSKVIEINPGYAEAYKNRGLSYFYAGRYDSALEDFNKAIALSHNPSSVYVHRGNLYLKAGNKELAVADFQKACGLGEKMGCSELQVLQQ